MAHGASRDVAAGPGRGHRTWPVMLPLLLLAWGCSTPSQEPVRAPGPAGGPEQTFANLELRETTAGRLEWKLRASRAVRTNASSATRMESLRVEFFEGRPEVRSVLVSDSGRVDLQKGILIATGHVVVTTSEGNRLETEELFWDRKNAKVSSSVFVRMTRGSDVLTGVGFESDPHLEHYEIKKDVQASVRESEGLRDGFLGPDSSGHGR
jgi:LPS export ABC transporter protein LptC